MSKPKTILKFMTCGSVDDGKSTLLGKLLFDSNNIFEDQKLELFKRNEIDYSLLLDGLSSFRIALNSEAIASNPFTSELQRENKELPLMLHSDILIPLSVNLLY